jgi:hypothetical protein
MATKAESDLVFDFLKTRANSATHPLTKTTELENVLGRKLGLIEYQELLDPIYEDVKRRQRRPDITLTVITGDGYPAFISDGGPARSVRFDPNKHKHMALWIAELNRVWATRW